MKNNMLKGIILVLLITIILESFIGCSDNNIGTNKTQENSGSITLIGSTALQPLAEATAKKFINSNRKAIINVQGKK